MKKRIAFFILLTFSFVAFADNTSDIVSDNTDDSFVENNQDTSDEKKIERIDVYKEKINWLKSYYNYEIIKINYELSDFSLQGDERVILEELLSIYESQLILLDKYLIILKRNDKDAQVRIEKQIDDLDLRANLVRIDIDILKFNNKMYLWLKEKNNSNIQSYVNEILDLYDYLKILRYDESDLKMKLKATYRDIEYKTEELKIEIFGEEKIKILK